MQFTATLRGFSLAYPTRGGHSWYCSIMMRAQPQSIFHEIFSVPSSILTLSSSWHSVQSYRATSLAARFGPQPWRRRYQISPDSRPLDAANLEAEGLLAGSAVGSHQIHKRRLNRFSHEEHRNIPLTPPDSLDAFVTIPDILISRETLTHVGLSTEKADELWQKWVN